MAAGDTQEIMEKFREKGRDLQQARAALRLAVQNEDAADANHDAVLDAIHKRTEEAIAHYKQLNIVPLEEERRQLSAEIESSEYGSIEKVMLAERAEAISRAILHHYTVIVDQRASFLPTDLKAPEEEEEQYALLQAAQSATYEAEANYLRLRGETAATFVDTRKELLERIGFVDFLYFSACVSTTTTFGDITANNAFVRLLVVVQILSGIVIVSMLLREV
tara:strand:+ start:129 stop:791 length:663 start_codon:yes stop_codon:yes gene_type:complete